MNEIICLTYTVNYTILGRKRNNSALVIQMGKKTRLLCVVMRTPKPPSAPISECGIKVARNTDAVQTQERYLSLRPFFQYESQGAGSIPASVVVRLRGSLVAERDSFLFFMG